MGRKLIAEGDLEKLVNAIEGKPSMAHQAAVVKWAVRTMIRGSLYRLVLEGKLTVRVDEKGTLHFRAVEKEMDK